MSKYVIEMSPDYMATSLWPISKNAYDDLGIPIEYETLNLSKELIDRLKQFDDKIMDLVDWSEPHNPPPLSKEERFELLKTGKKLLELVRKELGSEFEVKDGLDWIVAEFKDKP